MLLLTFVDKPCHRGTDIGIRQYILCKMIMPAYIHRHIRPTGITVFSNLFRFRGNRKREIIKRMLYNGEDIATIPDNLTSRGVKNIINRVCEITTRFINQQTEIIASLLNESKTPWTRSI